MGRDSRDRIFQLVGGSSFLSAFSFLGSEVMLGGGAILLICLFAWKHHIIGGIVVLIGVGGGNMLNKALKEWVARGRPNFRRGKTDLALSADMKWSESISICCSRTSYQYIRIKKNCIQHRRIASCFFIPYKPSR